MSSRPVKSAGYVVAAILLGSLAVILFVRNGGLDSDRAEAERLYGGPPSKFLELDGVRLHYRDEGRGPALVLLHGSRASLHQWDGWVRELRDAFRVIRVDARAHGLSLPDEGGDYSPDRGVELLRLLLDELNLEEFHLGGTSSGSVQAVRFAAAHPGRVKQLVLSTVPLKLPATMETPLSRRAVFWLHQRVLNSTATGWYWRHFLEGIYADPNKVTDELVRRYRILNSFPERRAEQQRLIDKWYELGGPEPDYLRAARITAPVLIQWGAAGPVLPLELQCEIAQAFSAATVRVITYPDLGHKLIMEDAFRTAQDAARYLTGHDVGNSCDTVQAHAMLPLD